MQPNAYTVADGTREAGVFDETAPTSGSYTLRHWNVLLPSGTAVGRYEATTGGGLAARYYYTDHLGSVRTVVSQGGTVEETRDYYPYGLEMPGRVSVAGLKGPEGYTGHELDAETEMNYAGARYYMPMLGRWTTTDPLADDPTQRGLSPYNYAWNNPANLTDPDGRCVPACAAAAPAGGAAVLYAAGAALTLAGAVAVALNQDRMAETYDSAGEAMYEKGGALIDWAAEQVGEVIESFPGAEPAENIETLDPPAVDAQRGVEGFDTRSGDDLGGILMSSGLPDVSKAINSNLPHAVERGVEHGIFENAAAAAASLRELSKSITSGGLPSNAIRDSSRDDRVLVPVGNGGLAVYQVAKNGTAKLKTVLIAR